MPSQPPGWARIAPTAGPIGAFGSRFGNLVAIQPGHELVTTGPCRTVRDPSYQGLLIGALGRALPFGSRAGVLPAALMHAEEHTCRSRNSARPTPAGGGPGASFPGIY